MFEEERELTMVLLVDVSAQKALAQGRKQKVDDYREKVLAFSAIKNNDKVGVLLVIRSKNTSHHKKANIFLGL